MRPTEPDKGPLNVSDVRREGRDNPTILIVDVDLEILRMLQPVLEHQEYRVLTATSGLAALELIRTSRSLGWMGSPCAARSKRIRGSDISL